MWTKLMVVFLRTSSNCKRANHKLPKTTKITKLLVGNSTPMLSLASTNTTPHWHNKSFPRSKKLWWMYLWLWSTDSVVQVLLLMSPRLHLQNSKIIISKRILHSHIWDQGSKDLMEGGGAYMSDWPVRSSPSSSPSSARTAHTCSRWT